MSWDDETGPWGQRNKSQGGWGRGNKPDVENIFKAGQDKLRSMIPGGGGSSTAAIIVVLLGLLWVSNCLYTVREDERGVVLRFGKWVRTESPGLNFCFAPFETVLRPSVMRVNQLESGFLRSRTEAETPDDTLMLTGDENLLDVNFTVLWRIKDVRQFLFHTRNPEITIKAAAESAVREIIAQSPRAYAQTDGRNEINRLASALLQKMMDEYEIGVEIIEVQLQRVDAPAPVADAFLDVQRARADEVRAKDVAEAYRNDILPRARGEASQMMEEAEGYRQSRIMLAEGEVAGFEKIYKEYRQAPAPEVIKERLYHETMQEVMGAAKKVITDPKIVTYFPVPTAIKAVPEGAK